MLWSPHFHWAAALKIQQYRILSPFKSHFNQACVVHLSLVVKRHSGGDGADSDAILSADSGSLHGKGKKQMQPKMPGDPILGNVNEPRLQGWHRQSTLIPRAFQPISRPLAIEVQAPNPRMLGT